MTRAEIIEHIIRDIEFLGYRTMILPVDRPYTNGKRNVVIYPKYSTAFEMAHEMIHAKYGDTDRKTLCDTTSFYEKEQIRKQLFIYGNYLNLKVEILTTFLYSLILQVVLMINLFLLFIKCMKNSMQFKEK